MNFLQILLVIYCVLQVLCLILYIPRIILWFEGFKKQKHLKREEKAKFGVIICARNESKTISPLLESIKSQTYPREFYDIHIVVADGNDPTITMVKSQIENSVIHIVKNQKRKAEALDACFHNILNDNKYTYDDYLIVDADCVLTNNYLEEMNNALESGAEVIVPRKRIKNWESSNKKNRNIFCNCSAMTYVGLDAMGNKGKSKRKHTLALCGQGMLIKASVIEKLGGYPFRSLTEDYEIAVECLRNGYKQFYYEYAELYSEEPITRKEFNKRRVRWIQGFAQFSKTYNKEITQLTFKCGRIKTENFFFLYGLLPVCFMFAGSLILLLTYLISAFILGVCENALALTALLYTLIPIGVSYLQLFVYGIFQICEDSDINKMTIGEKLKFIFAYPIITFEYVWIFIYAFCVKCDGNWDPVKRIEM